MGLIRKTLFTVTGGAVSPNSKKQRLQMQAVAAAQGKSEEDVRRAGGRRERWQQAREDWQHALQRPPEPPPQATASENPEQRAKREELQKFFGVRITEPLRPPSRGRPGSQLPLGLEWTDDLGRWRVVQTGDDQGNRYEVHFSDPLPGVGDPVPMNATSLDQARGFVNGFSDSWQGHQVIRITRNGERQLVPDSELFSEPGTDAAEAARRAAAREAEAERRKREAEAVERDPEVERLRREYEEIMATVSPRTLREPPSVFSKKYSSVSAAGKALENARKAARVRLGFDKAAE